MKAQLTERFLINEVFDAQSTSALLPLLINAATLLLQSRLLKLSHLSNIVPVLL